MELGGYANRVARIDLSAGAVAYEPLNEDDVRKYIGARGLGVKYVLDNGPEIDPDSAEMRVLGMRDLQSHLTPFGLTNPCPAGNFAGA